jgi:hypothetical protein
MKRKSFFALTAILTVGLMFVGCPQGDPESATRPTTGSSAFEKLEPWTPAPINEPAAGYKAFPKQGLLDNTAFYVISGGEGFIEDNEDGTYKVTVVTKSGGLSLISFQDENYQYKTGFYLSLDLPEATATAPHKPIGMMAYASKGMQENGADWNSTQYVNLATDTAPIKDDVYLAGRVDFTWENRDNPWPLRTICLRIYWHADEENGTEYEFTVRKISVPEDDDLTEPQYPVEVWTPDLIPAPSAGWKDFPAASITGATAVTTGGAAAVTVQSVTGGYSITIPTYADGHTDITFPASAGSVFIDGYYISLVLPENDTPALRPYRVYAYPGSYWAGAVDLYPTIGYYVGGNVDMQWTNSETEPNEDPLHTITLQFYWHSDEPADGSYTFTLKKLMITDDDYTPSDPWADFVEFNTYTDPIDQVIAVNWDGSYNQCYTNIENPDGKLFTGGFYVSITLAETNTVIPTRVLITGYDAADTVPDGWVTQTIITSFPDNNIGAFWNGNLWSGDPSATEYKKIEVIFQWDVTETDGSELGEHFIYTINAAKVGALVP